MQLKAEQNSLLIKKLAEKYGFEGCGISRSGFLEKEAGRMEQWLKSGYQGKMQYLENHFDLRTDPAKLVPGAKSVISLLYGYMPQKLQNQETYMIARYAYGDDYHNVIRGKLKALLRDLKAETGDIAARVFVDSGPVMERVWAERSGLGWIGKHGLLINKNKGSWFLLAEIITDLECEPDLPVKDHCGTCTRCIDACPTDAILPDKTLNASKCISYLTIELKDRIPEEFKGKTGDWIFGCDICQEVCPWNRFSEPAEEERFKPSEELLEMTKEEWERLTPGIFDEMFGKSPLKRTGYQGLMRNIDFSVSGKSKT